MEKENRLGLDDNLTTIIMKLSDGNPGAITSLVNIVKELKIIDKDSAFGNIGPLISLDSYKIYGTNIYILYNDKCNQDNRKFHLLLRACQLGILSINKLKEYSEDQFNELNITDEEWEDIDKKICSKLDNFITKEEYYEKRYD
jgi:hypothetical protein